MRFGTKIDGGEGWEARLEPRFGDRREFFRWLRETGIGFIEFSCDDRPREDILLDYAECCAEAGLGVSLHPYTKQASPAGFGVGPVEEGNRRLLRLAERMAEAAGRPQRMVLHAGLARTGHYAPDYAEGMARARGFFQWLDAEVREKFPTVMPFCETAMPAEDQDDFERLADTWDTVLELLDGTELGACWDTGHAFLSAAYGKQEEMPPERFVQRVKHMHLHDVVSKDGRLRDHYPPGEGISPWREYAGLLAQNGYDGWVLFERSAHLYADRDALRQALGPGMRELCSIFADAPG